MSIRIVCYEFSSEHMWYERWKIEKFTRSGHISVISHKYNIRTKPQHLNQNSNINSNKCTISNLSLYCNWTLGNPLDAPTRTGWTMSFHFLLWEQLWIVHGIEQSLVPVHNHTKYEYFTTIYRRFVFFHHVVFEWNCLDSYLNICAGIPYFQSIYDDTHRVKQQNDMILMKNTAKFIQINGKYQAIAVMKKQHMWCENVKKTFFVNWSMDYVHWTYDYVDIRTKK